MNALTSGDIARLHSCTPQNARHLLRRLAREGYRVARIRSRRGLPSLVIPLAEYERWRGLPFQPGELARVA